MDDIKIMSWLSDHTILIGVVKDDGETEYVKINPDVESFRESMTNLILRSESDGQFIEVPNMRLHKDDIKSLYEGRDDFEEKCKEIDNLSEDEFKEIARKLSKTLMQDWSLCLKSAYED